MTMTTDDKRGDVANERDRTPATAATARIGHETGTKRVRKGHGLGTVLPALKIHNPRSHHRLRRPKKHCFPRLHQSAKRTHPARCFALSSILPPPPSPPRPRRLCGSSPALHCQTNPPRATSRLPIRVHLRFHPLKSR